MTKLPGTALAASILGMALAALPASALTPPALQIAITGASVTIDSTGVQTYTGTCSASACPGTATLASGSISWTGSIGTFSISTLTGRSTRSSGSPSLDVGVAAITTGATGGTVTISWTDTGFTVGSSPGTLNIVAAGVGSTVYTGYDDNTNTAFGTKTLLGTSSLGGLLNGLLTGLIPGSDTFSMTEVEAITLPAGVGSDFPPFNNDFSLQISPNAPLALACGTATGTVGTPYNSGLVATGGTAPYNYSITSGSISPLVLAATTGKITGTPTVGGVTLSFTAQVVDSSGLTGLNTVSQACSIVLPPVVTTGGSGSGGTTPPPPLKALCPTSTATVGTYYSSTVAVTGGTKPYTWAVAFGSLPAGLTLNTSTGVISGTPTTASQTGSFKIQVTDANKTSVYTNCSGSCSNGVTVSYGGSQSQSGWGQKGYSSTYTSNGVPLNVYGYSTSGSPANLYSGNNWGGAVLGISSWSNQNQIDNAHFVQFDISNNTSLGATSAALCVTSYDWNASYDIYGSNSKGSLGTLLAGNIQAGLSTFQSIPNFNSYHYICLKAHSGDVVVASVQFSYPCSCAIDVSSAQNNGYGGGGYGSGGYGSGGNSGSGGGDWWNQGGYGNSGNGGSSWGSGGGSGYGSGGSSGYGGGGSSGSGQGDSPGQCGW